jgi:signal transduction histidine kinase
LQETGYTLGLKVLAYPAAIILALLATRYYNGVLLFHTLAELFSIFVGLLMLVVVLNTQHFVRNDFLIYLGVGYFSISVLDALHAFTIKGIPFFHITSGEVTIHFWIYSRIFEALLLLSAPLLLTRRLNVQVMIMVTASLVCLITWASFYVVWPVMFVDDTLTDFKVYSEFVVVALLITSIFVYWYKRSLFEKNVLFYLISSLALTVMAELCFTLYTSFTGNAFVVGHIFKFLSFWMIYQAIIQTTLNEPLKLLTISSNSYDAIPNPAIRVDEFTMISQVNRAALEVITKVANTKVEQLIYQPVHEFFHPASIEKSRCPFCSAIKKGKTISDQEVYFSQFKQWYLLSITPVDPNSSKGGMVQSLTNITYQKRQEEELLDHKNLLEQRVKERTEALELSFEQLAKAQTQLVESKKMASLGDLVAGVAHEINTPVGVCITAASNLSELTASLKKDFNNEQVSKSGFEHYIEAAEKSSALIESSLSRAAELVGSFKQVAVDQSSECLRIFLIKEYITEVLSSLSPKFKGKKITVNFNTDDDFQVHTSPSAIAQIVTNLIINSLIHGFEAEDNGEITIAISRKINRVSLIYQDSGKGISVQDLAKIYEPFFTTKRGQGGSGLGLHITYNLVHQSLNGSIICTSEEGKGAVFTIEFPAGKTIE